MDLQEYRCAGYLVSQNVSQTVIDGAEAEIKQAYILPVCPQADTTSPAVKAALMELTTLRLLQRTAQVTRAGGKAKTLSQSVIPTADELLQQHAATCCMRMTKLAESCGVERWEKIVTDICHILFKSNYFYL